ncbi:hypothetical protein SAMN02927924_01865 [Sphingobium faniae]|nr:hypothetical protein SAMN02927924_01865 [Sphingobium faniae]
MPAFTALGLTPATASIQSGTRSLANRHEQIASLFGVPRSRALWIAQTAEYMNITVGVARDYAMTRYAGMGAPGQSGFMRYTDQRGGTRVTRDQRGSGVRKCAGSR